MAGRRHIALWTGLAVFALDQATKLAVVHGLGLKALGAIPVAPPWLSFRMAWNTGINFGLLSGNAEAMRWVLIGVALAISAWVVWFIRREEAGPWARASAGMLVGGALGNVVDRVVYGAVADFLNVSCCGFDNPYAFNVADIAIFAGAFGLIFFAPERGAAKAPADAPRPRRRAPAGPRKVPPAPPAGGGAGPARKGRDGPSDPR